jgi:OOP family OmpA-OmpF porin
MTFKQTVLATLLLAGASGATFAADYYVGASVGQADYRIDTTGATNADTKDTAGKIFGGMMFTPHFGIEASLFSLGEARGTLAVPGVGLATSTGKVNGIGLYGVAAMPLGSFSVFGKVGGTYARAKTSASGAFGSFSETESSFQPAAGIGASYAINANLGVRAEFERMRIKFAGDEKDDINLMTVGVTYRF